MLLMLYYAKCKHTLICYKVECTSRVQYQSIAETCRIKNCLLFGWKLMKLLTDYGYIYKACYAFTKVRDLSIQLYISFVHGGYLPINGCSLGVANQQRFPFIKHSRLQFKECYSIQVLTNESVRIRDLASRSVPEDIQMLVHELHGEGDLDVLQIHVE